MRDLRMEAVKDWVCLECGKRITARAAERAVNGNDGCSGCGSVDIDLYVSSEASAVSK